MKHKVKLNFIPIRGTADSQYHHTEWTVDILLPNIICLEELSRYPRMGVNVLKSYATA